MLVLRNPNKDGVEPERAYLQHTVTVDPRHDLADAATLAAASSGDHDALKRLTDPYMREIHLHCYRMLGSFHDAQDASQDTLLRAWEYLGSLQDPGSLRAWLHRISTNVCLRQRAHAANDLIMKSATLDALTPSVTPPYNLSPYPDALLTELQSPGGNPAVEYDLYESVQLAFLVAMQRLPPRQRAVLLLHDVVGFTLADVADTQHCGNFGLTAVCSAQSQSQRKSRNDRRALSRGLASGRCCETCRTPQG